VVLILGVVVETLFVITKSYRATAVTRSINISSLLALERMERDIRNASSIDQAQSIFGASPGKLIVLTPATTTEFYSDSTGILVKENDIFKDSLTSSLVTPSNLRFYLISTGKSSGIKIELTLQSGTGTTFRSEKFYDTVMLRSSY